MRIDEVIDEALDLLYGSFEQKQQGIVKIISCCRDQKALEYLIQHHQFMSALTRLFSEDTKEELLIAIAKVFLAFASIEDFHETLASYRIGLLTIGVLKQACHRGNNAAAAFTKRQEQLVLVCSCILCHVADDFAALRKMAKKSLAQTLRHCLVHMKTIQSTNAVLALLLKLSIFEEAADELGERNAIDKLVGLLSLVDVSHKVASVLFNMTFHDQCFSIVSSSDIFSPITKMIGKKLAPSIYKLAYQLSCNEENRNKFVAAGIAPKLRDILQHQHEPIESSEAGLLTNMSMHPICAEELVRGGVVGGTLHVVIHDSDDEFTIQTLLKVLRNISVWSRELQSRLHIALVDHDNSHLDGFVKRVDSYLSTEEMNAPKQTHVTYWEHHIWDSNIELILQSALECESDELLVEWIGILSNMTNDDMPAGLHWHDLILQNSSKILHLCHRILDSSHNDLKTEVIIWLGMLCTSQKGSAWIASSNLIEAMHEAHERGSDEMKLEILQSYKQFMIFDETRFQVVGGQGKSYAV
jgi:hypothetical protein